MSISEETVALAAAWKRGAPELADAMYAELVEHIPGARRDPELAALTLASCSSNLEAVVSMVASGIPASAAQAPVTALEHARLMAARGAEVNETLRFYRLGLGFVLRRWSVDLRAAVGDDLDRFAASMDEVTAFAVEYLDVVSARVSAEHLAERERRQRRTALVRADVVRALLDGAPIDLVAAERTLAHRLDRAQQAFVCWSTPSSPHIERTAMAVAEVLGASRPLLVPEGSDAVAGWVVPAGASIAAVDAARRAAAPDVAVAIGSVGSGVEGFRTSRDEADRARRLAVLAGGDARTCVAYEDVALVDLLSRDVGAAQRFLARELGALAARDPAVAAVRETALAVLAPRGGVAEAARRLGVHRNTVLQRLRRAEALRGRSLDERPEELHAALLLTRALPAWVHPGAT